MTCRGYHWYSAHVGDVRDRCVRWGCEKLNPKCRDCGRRTMDEMDDGSGICRSCGHVVPPVTP